jgi:PAS domain S-box-containing protein
MSFFELNTADTISIVVEPSRETASATLGESLRQSEERFRLLIENVRDYAIFLLDTEGRVLTWNPGAERIKGYKPHDIIGRHFSTFYPADAIDRQWPQFELKMAAQNGRFEDENWRVKKDGSLFWANVVITALRDANGQLTGFAKITRDLTERREQEERLRQSEERFRLLVENVVDYAIFMLDPAGQVVSWNRGAERITGYKPSEIVGLHFSRFFTPAEIDARKPEEELVDALRNGSIQREGWRVRKDGSRYWADVTLAAVFDGKGQHHGFTKITRDLTQRRQVEQLEESSRRINEFLAMLAHELRNPLAPLRNAVSVMQMAKVQDGTINWARDVIDRQVTHMTRLVDDLLDISRITSGKITLRCHPVDGNDVVLRAVEVARPLIDSRRHQLTIFAAPKPVIVEGDTTRLGQVVVNLLNNAAKYTPEGGRIEVSVGQQDGTALIKVKDNGLGISETLLPKVFDLFAQGERSLARAEGGLGIGLTLARRIVEMHRGTIEAASGGLNLGSEFTVRLPLATWKSADTPGSADEYFTAAGVCRVLVVDDNDDSAQTMAMMLQLEGHRAKVAHDGRAALDVAREFKPHVVLLDIGLPEMDGFDVARRMRETPDLADTMLVAMTGYGQEEDRRRTSQAGFAHHLVKPIDPEALKRVIASAGCEG